MKLLKPHFNLIINVSDEERESAKCERKRKGESMKQLHARTRTYTSIHLFFIWHFTCSMLIHLWMGAASMNYRFFRLSFTDWGGAFTHCMRIWLFILFIFFFFFVSGCGNCDLTKNQKYVTILHHHHHQQYHMCAVSCLVLIQYVIEFI